MRYELNCDTFGTLDDKSAVWMTLANKIINTKTHEQMAGANVVLAADHGLPAPPTGGTHVIRAWSLVSGVNCQVRLAQPPAQSDVIAGGRYHRFEFLIPKGTLLATAKTPHSQTKLLLTRADVDPTGFVCVGQGNDFNSTNNAIAARVDWQTQMIKNGAPITPDVWHLLEATIRRDVKANVGLISVWYDSVLVGTRAHQMAGTNAPKTPRDFASGHVWTQGVNGLTETYSCGQLVTDTIPSGRSV